MRERTEQTTPDDDDAREAMVREQLGGPADYDESGGTGLGAGQDGDRSSAASQEDRDADAADQQQQGRSP